MARSINRAELLGYTGGDPEVRTTQRGDKVATLTLATSREWKDKEGVKHEATQWHRLVVWGKLAAIFDQYIPKGSRIFVAGPIEYRKWDDKDGVTRYSTEINVQEVLMLGDPGGAKKPAAGSGKQPEGDYDPLQDQDDDIPF